MDQASATGETSARKFSRAEWWMPAKRWALIGLGIGGAIAGLASGWDWVVAAGLAPLVVSVLPCIAMCALGNSVMSAPVYVRWRDAAWAECSRRLYLMLLRAGLCFALFVAIDAGADEAAVKRQFERRFPGAAVTSVAPAPLPGLYEVFVEGQLVYTDAEVNYLLKGELIDATDRRNLTEERLGKLKGIPFEQLPLDQAVKIVKGDGKRRVAIFEDPDCPFCKRLEQELVRVDNVTMYVLLYPLESIHPGATEKSIRIWCSADRGKAWSDAVLRGVNASGTTSCKHPIESLKKFAEARGIFATPTLVFEDGTRVAGAIPAAEIEKRLAVRR